VQCLLLDMLRFILICFAISIPPSFAIEVGFCATVSIHVIFSCEPWELVSFQHPVIEFLSVRRNSDT